jgi:hypothetical protein
VPSLPTTGVPPLVSAAVTVAFPGASAVIGCRSSETRLPLEHIHTDTGTVVARPWCC